MEEYRIYLDTRNTAKADQIKNLIWSIHELGYFIKYEGANFSPDEALDFLFNEKGTIEIIKTYKDYFYAYIANKTLCLYSNFLRSNLLIEFKHGINPNTISQLKLFLHFAKSFLLTSITLKTDLELFYELKSPISDYDTDQMVFSDSEKNQAKDLNAIHAYVLILEKEYLSDALDIVNLATKYGYRFIDNPLNQKVLGFFDANSEVSEAMNKGRSTKQYLIVDNFIMKLMFNGQLISLCPIEPFKMKTVDNETGIDIAFYLTIYLNLVQPFGIDDLITTFKEKD